MTEDSQEAAGAEEGLHHQEGVEVAGEVVVAWFLCAPGAESRETRLRRGGRPSSTEGRRRRDRRRYSIMTRQVFELGLGAGNAWKGGRGYADDEARVQAKMPRGRCSLMPKACD